MATSTPIYNLPIAGSGDPANAPVNDASMMGAVETAIVGQFVIKPSNQTVTSSVTTVNDTALFLPVVANAKYIFNLDLIYSCITAGGLQFGFVAPTGATATWCPDGLASGTATFAGSILRQDYDLTVAASIGGGPTTGTTQHAFPRGILTTVGTAGNLTLSWAQATANASGTIMRTGSSMFMKRIA